MKYLLNSNAGVYKELKTGHKYRVTYYKEDLNRASIATEDLMFRNEDVKTFHNVIGLRFEDLTQDIVIVNNSPPPDLLPNPNFWKLIKLTNIIDIEEIEHKDVIVDLHLKSDYEGEHKFKFEV